jgi:hypothetical protein
MINDKQWYTRPIMRTPTEPSNHTGIYQAERRGIKDFCIARVYDKQDVDIIARAPLLIECREVIAMFASVRDLKALCDAPAYFDIAMDKARTLLTKLDGE